MVKRSTNAAEALEVMISLLERHGQGGSGHDPASVPGGRPYWSSFLVADARSAWVLETSARTWAAERVERTRAISNRTTIPAFDAAHRHPRQPVATLVDPRWRASQSVLAAEPVTVGALMRHLRSHEPAGSPGWSVCMHVADVEVTTSSMIAELSPTAPPVAWVLVGSPCQHRYRRVVVGPDAARLLAEP